MSNRENILQFIGANPNCMSREICKALNLKTSPVTASLNYMFKRGVVKRTPHSGLTGVYYTYTLATYGTKVEPVKVEPVKVEPVKVEPVMLSAKPTPKPPVKVEPVKAPVVLPPPEPLDIGEIINSLSNRIVEQVVAQVRDKLALELGRLERSTQVSETVAFKRPKIGVVGLMPVQAGEISREFADCMDLRFWQDESNDKLKSIGANCEAVFVHIRHVAHQTSETLKNVGANVINVVGGVSKMKNALTEYFVEG